jgi:Transposase DDE domain/Insertion element 4 transposase N-terminal
MSTSTVPNRAQILKQKFIHSTGLPFEELLPASQIEKAVKELSIKYKNRLFSPVVTIWAFLSQVLDFDKSCQNAVSRIISWLSGENVELPSTDTSAYCQARKRLPEKLLQRLFEDSGKNLESKVNLLNLWCGRHVKVIDCSTVSMPDTPENQQAYPQSTSQQPGCGFPIASICVIFSLITGAAIALAIDKLNTNDIKLARRIYQFLNPLDILLGDSAFCSYADFCWICNNRCDAVVRKHNGRCQKLQGGFRVGKNDKILTWYKPKTPPTTLTKEEFAALPDNLKIREIYYSINTPGFRTKSVTLITTLLDTKAFPTHKIIELYGSRWDVELDLRHLKTSLGMDILRSKSPDMVRKEIYTYLLAYNLLRSVMWTAGTTNSTSPLRLSLQGTRRHLINFSTKFLYASKTLRYKLYLTLLKIIVHKVVPHRPERVEPRKLKKRSKNYPYLTQSRKIVQSLMKI